MASLGLVGVAAGVAFAGGTTKDWTCPSGYIGCTGMTVTCNSKQAACCCPVTPPTTPRTWVCSCQSADCNGNGACVMGS
ncbi:MAG: hypothetical protein IT437_07005 [Phycisphaerales bacterium]|nr:hypothetical protein [Phycisphaerales bacterium]